MICMYLISCSHKVQCCDLALTMHLEYEALIQQLVSRQMELAEVLEEKVSVVDVLFIIRSSVFAIGVGALVLRTLRLENEAAHTHTHTDNASARPVPLKGDQPSCGQQDDIAAGSVGHTEV